MTNIVTTESGEKFTLFFTIRSPFSNFHPCRFTIFEDVGNGKPEEKCYYSTEQYYMFVLFSLKQVKRFFSQLQLLVCIIFSLI